MKPIPWDKRKFSERPNTIKITCLACGRSMWVPPCKEHVVKTCDKECSQQLRNRDAVARRRPCDTCGNVFSPRPWLLRQGRGRYCSTACRPAEHLTTPDNIARAHENRRSALNSGKTKMPRGAQNKQWRGGPGEAFRRRIESGKAAAFTREYRAKNPERVREWKQRRKGGKVLPRLPYGTIPRLGAMQGWRCAICRCGVKGGYHLDHILPIAKGGKHEPRNLQLLCASCNFRKSAKDPIAHMQSLGRLL